MIIALDVMGGDQGPEMVISAAELAAIRHPNCHFLLYGDQIRIAPLLAKTDRLKGRADIRHCDVVVGAEDRPSQALRRGRNVSSMWRAIDAVGLGEADLAVSAGNTGALMAMARFVLKTMPGISRPAIAVIWPTLRGETIVLDMGATIGANQLQLVEFAFMGSAMARCLFGLQRPSVALLNVGVEEIKGLEEVKAAAGLLRKLDVALEYVGFAEGDDIAKGRADVIVTEGFTGNIALKTAEGTARQISTYMRQAIKRTWLSRLGAFLAQGAFAALKERMDPRKYNGGVFLGLNGIVVKSHGGSDAVGFATAVDLAINMKRNDLVAKIHADTHILERLRLSPENSRDI